MSPLQRVIKGIAMTFAIILAVSIISVIIGAILKAFSFAVPKLPEKVETKYSNQVMVKTETMHYQNIEELEIYSTTAEVRIELEENADDFKVDLINVDESYKLIWNEENRKLRVDNGKKADFLSVIENGFEEDDNKGMILITVPEGTRFKSLFIDCNHERVTMESFQTAYFEMHAGIGETEVSNVNAEKVHLEVGSGDARFEECVFSDTNITCGMGEVVFDGKLLGNTMLRGSIGEVEMDLDNSIEEYEIRIDDGMGCVYLNEKEYSGSVKLGENAKNQMEIDAGVGDISVYFAD